jgi:hypothetical protein
MSFNEIDACSGKGDISSQIFLLIRELCLLQLNKTIRQADLEKKCLQKRFKLPDIEKCLEEYTQLNVLLRDIKKSEITLI